jgi:hypothetical protein
MTTYPPLNVLKPVGDGIWIVDSGPLLAGGLLPLPIRMTVTQLDDGTMLLHSPTEYDASLHHAIDQLGPIGHLIAPNSAHWSFIKRWKQEVPAALAWAAPGLRNRRPVKRPASLGMTILVLPRKRSGRHRSNRSRSRALAGFGRSASSTGEAAVWLSPI